ncbi:hypothetical protein KBY47_27540, partial [Streptomyces sp. B93]|nr:hypothetical protein [Streptomyces sp. B93]
MITDSTTKPNGAARAKRADGTAADATGVTETAGADGTAEGNEAAADAHETTRVTEPTEITGTKQANDTQAHTPGPTETAGAGNPARATLAPGTPGATPTPSATPTPRPTSPPGPTTPADKHDPDRPRFRLRGRHRRTRPHRLWLVAAALALAAGVLSLVQLAPDPGVGGPATARPEPRRTLPATPPALTTAPGDKPETAPEPHHPN